MRQDIVDSHYTRLADNYNRYLYYSPRFVRRLTGKMIEMLRLREDDTFVDLGCGTAIYSLDIIDQVPLRTPVIAVDPFTEMLDQIADEAPVEKRPLTALEFSEQPGAYDKILIKEAIHHVREKARLFGNLHDRLTQHGILLLVHIPPRPDYPLFDKALERCETWHAHPDDLTRMLEEVGFRVERDTVEYDHALAKDHYVRMVRERYMSVLASFTDEELDHGIAEIEERYKDHDVLRFTDHFDYLAAIKS